MAYGLNEEYLNVVRQLNESNAENKQLRAELDAANKRVEDSEKRLSELSLKYYDACNKLGEAKRLVAKWSKTDDEYGLYKTLAMELDEAISGTGEAQR